MATEEAARERWEASSEVAATEAATAMAEAAAAATMAEAAARARWEAGSAAICLETPLLVLRKENCSHCRRTARRQQHERADHTTVSMLHSPS